MRTTEKPYAMTTQAQVRKDFWAHHRGVKVISQRRITDCSGTGKMHNTDTRCAFADWVDYLCRNQLISPALADRVTL